MSSEAFYAQIPPSPDLESCLRAGRCLPMPGDWDLALADVEGSTLAIQAGRYKEVNVVAASAIVGVLNALRDVDVPFVFGGDGATLAVPASRRPEAASALDAARRLAREQFGFSLRAAIIPVAEVRRRGSNVRLGRLAGAGAFPIGVLAGDGLRAAEQILKSRASSATDPAPQAENSAASFNGLECRWQPIRNRNGAIATLLVLPAAPDDDALLCEVLQKLRDAGAPPDTSPIDESQMRLATSAAALDAEARIRTRSLPGFLKPARLALMRIATGIGAFLMRQDLRLLGVDWGEYRRAIAANTDHLKLAGSLQCLLDADPASFARVTDWLEDRRRAGALCYGHHLEPTAHMTCMVLDRATRHFHFIDGSEGGYTRASQMLKAQLRTAR